MRPLYDLASVFANQILTAELESDKIYEPLIGVVTDNASSMKKAFEEEEVEEDEREDDHDIFFQEEEDEEVFPTTNVESDEKLFVHMRCHCHVFQLVIGDFLAR